MSKERNYNTPAMLKARIAATKKQTAKLQQKLDLLNELRALGEENYKVRCAIQEHSEFIGDGPV